MPLRFNIRFLALFLFTLPAGLHLHADSLEEQYQAAVNRINDRHNTRRDQLLSSYRNHLDRLIAESRPRGDIESIVIYQDEKAEPGTQPPTPALETARATLDAQREQIEQERAQEIRALAAIYLERLEHTVREYTRAGDLDRAIAASERIEAVRQKTEGNPVSDADGIDPSLLGPNLFPQGDFDAAPSDAWIQRIPRGGNNRSGFHIDTRAGHTRERNTVLRIHQDESRSVFFSHPVSLEAGKRYQLSWRTSMARPWRSGVELRGKGDYRIGVRIDDSQITQLSEEEQMLLRRSAEHTIAPPPSLTWQRHTVLLEPGPFMNHLFIRASRGEGEFLIDDLELREILDPGQPRQPPETPF